MCVGTMNGLPVACVSGPVGDVKRLGSSSGPYVTAKLEQARMQASFDTESR